MRFDVVSLSVLFILHVWQQDTKQRKWAGAAELDKKHKPCADCHPEIALYCTKKHIKLGGQSVKVAGESRESGPEPYHFLLHGVTHTHTHTHTQARPHVGQAYE